MSVTVYAARAMTGLPWKQVVRDALDDNEALADAGFDVLDPVMAEIGALGYVPCGNIGDDCCGSDDLEHHWRRDKRMIRESDVLIDFSPEHKSEGIAHEIGYARYFLWLPIVRVYRTRFKPAQSIAYFENDVIVESMEEAIDVIQENWGTWGKRVRWRLGMYARSLPKALWRKFRLWF